MSDLKVDGTFIFSSGASDWGIGSLILSSSGYEIEKYHIASLLYSLLISSLQHKQPLKLQLVSKALRKMLHGTILQTIISLF
jgi:hypothetical protein